MLSDDKYLNFSSHLSLSRISRNWIKQILFCLRKLSVKNSIIFNLNVRKNEEWDETIFSKNKERCLVFLALLFLVTSSWRGVHLGHSNELSQNIGVWHSKQRLVIKVCIILTKNIHLNLNKIILCNFCWILNQLVKFFQE